MDKTIEEEYGLTQNPVKLERFLTHTGKAIEVFEFSGRALVEIDFPEFTCLCPKTSHPDFAFLKIMYIPNGRCVELKSLKYYLNSFRNEGHFHEEVTCQIEKELRNILEPVKLVIIAEFNVRGGTYPTITAGDDIGE